MQLNSINNFLFLSPHANAKPSIGKTRVTSGDQFYFSGKKARRKNGPDPARIQLRAIEKDFQIRVRQVADYVAQNEALPLHSTFTVRQLSHVLNQPESVVAGAVTQLFESGRILLIGQDSLRDAPWMLIQKDKFQDNHVQTKSFFSDPAFIKLLQDQSDLGAYVARNHSRSIVDGQRAEFVGQIVADSLMSLRTAPDLGNYFYANPHSRFLGFLRTAPFWLDGSRLQEKMRVRSGVAVTEIPQEVVTRFSKGAEQAFVRAVQAEPVTDETADFLSEPVRISGDYPNIVKILHKEKVQVLNNLITSGRPGQPIIAQGPHLLGDCLYEVLDPGHEYLEGRQQCSDVVYSVHNPERNQTGRAATQAELEPRNAALEALCRQASRKYTFYGELPGQRRSTFTYELHAFVSQMSAAVLTDLIARGLLDEHYRFTDKVSEYQRMMPLAQRFMGPDIDRQFTFYLIPPSADSEEGQDRWTLAYCWSLPKQSEQENTRPRLNIPSTGYTLPSFSLSNELFQKKTEAAAKKAIRLSPTLASKGMFYPNVPPQPITLTTNEVRQFFKNNEARNLVNQGFAFLLPMEYLRGSSKTRKEALGRDSQRLLSGLKPKTPAVTDTAEPNAAQLEGEQWQECTDVADLKPFERQLTQDDRSAAGKELAEGNPTAADQSRALLLTLRNPEGLRIQDRLPQGFTATLFPFQNVGYSFIKHNADTPALGGAILADDMGLGKTVQALALIQDRYNREESGKLDKHPTLVVCPAQVIPEWKKQINAFTSIPPYKVKDLSTKSTIVNEDLKEGAAPPEKPELADAIFSNRDDIVVTSYDTLRLAVQRAQQINPAFFDKFPWDGIVLDEAHRIRTPGIQKTDIAHYLSPQAQYRLALTGTPIQNSPADLWALGKFVSPNAFPDLEDYDKKYVKPLKKNPDDREALNKLVVQFRPYLLRRTKEMPEILEEIGGNIPPIEHHRIFVPFEEPQLIKTDSALNALNAAREDRKGKGGKEPGQENPVNEMITALQLRQIALHPELVPPVGIIRPTIAMQEMADIIRNRVISNQQQMIIFTPYIDFNEILHNYLSQEFPGKRILIYDGRHKGSGSNSPINLFKKNVDNNYPVLIMTGDIGGEGLNLQNANHIIDFGPTTNPEAQNQRIGRAWRLSGNKHASEGAPVHVYYFTSYIRTAPGKPSKNDTVWLDENPFTDFDELRIPSGKGFKIPDDEELTVEINAANALRRKRRQTHQILNTGELSAPPENPGEELGKLLSAQGSAK